MVEYVKISCCNDTVKSKSKGILSVCLCSLKNEEDLG